MTTLLDLPPLSRPRWFRQLLAALREDALDVDVHRATAGVGALEAAQGVASMVRRIPYRFGGDGQEIVSVAHARVRGFAACGDAAAACAAAALLAGGAPVVLCYEALPAVPSYAHVRLHVDGVVVDAYPEASYDVPACSWREVLTRERVPWPDAGALDAARERARRYVAGVRPTLRS